MAGRIAGQGSKWIRKVKRLQIYCRDGFACVYCGSTVEDGIVLSLDHVLACELGGNNEAKNLVTSCVSCNSSKSDLSTRQWFTVLRDRGVDTTKLGARIRRLTATNIKQFKGTAQAMLAARGEAE